jgi:hypothetical protein
LVRQVLAQVDPGMCQSGETVITPQERMSRPRCRLTSTAFNKTALGPARRP